MFHKWSVTNVSRIKLLNRSGDSKRKHIWGLASTNMGVYGCNFQHLPGVTAQWQSLIAFESTILFTNAERNAFRTSVCLSNWSLLDYNSDMWESLSEDRLETVHTKINKDVLHTFDFWMFCYDCYKFKGKPVKLKIFVLYPLWRVHLTNIVQLCKILSKWFSPWFLAYYMLSLFS